MENLPKINFKVYLKNSIVGLDDLKEAIACKLDLCLVYDRFNIKALKEEIGKQKLVVENQYENSSICKELRFNIVKGNPYFCKYEDLNLSRDFNKVYKREIIKPFALGYTTKNRVERYDKNLFRMNTSTEITIEKVSVKISINQIATFLQMIKGTSTILQEKYIDKLKKDEEMLSGRKNPNSSLIKGSNIDSVESQTEDTSNFRVTYEIFSSRYNKVPKAKILSHFDVDDEEEEKTALDSKEANLSKLKTPSVFHKNSDRAYSNSQKALEETKKTNYEEMESNGSNTYNFFFHGLRIYFINDYGDNFYPVMGLKLRETNYSKDIRIDGSFVSQSQLNASFFYYNSTNGYWEPCIEGLDIEFFYDKQGESKVFQVKGKELININISPSFISVVNNCWDSWNQAQIQIEKDRRKSLKGEAIKDSLDYLSEDVKFKEEVKCSALSEIASGLYTNQKESNLVDIATPYKITNLTGLTIFIETLFDDK